MRRGLQETTTTLDDTLCNSSRGGEAAGPRPQASKLPGLVSSLFGDLRVSDYAWYVAGAAKAVGGRV